MKEKNVICSNMDGPGKCHMSEVSQTEKNKYHIAYMWDLKKKVQVNVFTKQK